MIATFASPKLLSIATKLNRNYVTQIMIQQFVPVPQSHEIPVPVFTELPSLEDEDDIYESDKNHGHVSDTDFISILNKEHENFNQAEHNDLIIY